MTGPCFVDANVFVYARDPRDPRKQGRSAQWLDLLWRERLGRTSAQAIAEFYAVATRKLSMPAERAWQYAERYFAWQPVAVDEVLLRRAREVEQRYRLSWWDSMIVAAAQLQDCVLLLTEDLQDGMVLGGVTVRSPFTLAIGEPAAHDDVAPMTASRHRPRGRPKRVTERATAG
ncbi:MAG: PIN domain-containing protein [Betaproteobacteria bacterium]|nr:PIN domain-containing protein [Betaproteobacteria bacterium]